MSEIINKSVTSYCLLYRQYSLNNTSHNPTVTPDVELGY